MSRFKVIVSVLAACALAAAIQAQNADQNTAGPTRNDYRLRLVQPVEGARIVGDKIQVVVDMDIPAERDTRPDVNSMPRPQIDVFLNDLYQGTMRGEANVLDLENVPFGEHEIVLLAKNMSSEIIDRKVLHVITVASKVVPAEARRPEPVPAPPPVAATVPPASEPEAAPAPAPVQDLPKTGTNKAVLLAAGLVLLFGALVIRRFRLTTR